MISCARKQRNKTDFLPVDNGNGTASVPLHDGTVAIIDSMDVCRVGFIGWHRRIEPDGNNYALGNAPVSCVSKKPKIIRMHRLILCFPLFDVDHINGDGLDNRRCNLRFCTNSQNQGNSRKRKPGLSKYKGVTYNKRAKLWVCQLMLNRKRVFSRYCRTEREAALTYDKAAIQYFGEYAWLNCNNFAELSEVAS